MLIHAFLTVTMSSEKNIGWKLYSSTSQWEKDIYTVAPHTYNYKLPFGIYRVFLGIYRDL
jgi:hypothetical protein